MVFGKRLPEMSQALVRAHPNIALVKYWGKRDTSLNLPAVGSISITLYTLHTKNTSVNVDVPKKKGSKPELVPEE